MSTLPPTAIRLRIDFAPSTGAPDVGQLIELDVRSVLLLHLH